MSLKVESVASVDLSRPVVRHNLFLGGLFGGVYVGANHHNV